MAKPKPQINPKYRTAKTRSFDVFAKYKAIQDRLKRFITIISKGSGVTLATTGGTGKVLVNDLVTKKLNPGNCVNKAAVISLVLLKTYLPNENELKAMLETSIKLTVCK